MWRVSDDDSHVWLFGSIHLFSRQMNWRTQTFDAALQDSEQVWFEMVFDAAAYATIARLTILDGRLRDGQRLSDLLTEDQNERLDRAIAAAGLDPLVFDRLQPWMAEVTLSSGSVQGTTAGVDILIDAEVSSRQEARTSRRRRSNWGFFSRVPLDQQIDSLMATIDALQAGGIERTAGAHDRRVGERRHRGAGCADPAGDGVRRRCPLPAAADGAQCSLGCDHRGRSSPPGRRVDGDRRGRAPGRPRWAARAARAARVRRSSGSARRRRPRRSRQDDAELRLFGGRDLAATIGHVATSGQQAFDGDVLVEFLPVKAARAQIEALALLNGGLFEDREPGQRHTQGATIGQVDPEPAAVKPDISRLHQRSCSRRFRLFHVAPR
jgi:hypothetical protein